MQRRLVLVLIPVLFLAACSSVTAFFDRDRKPATGPVSATMDKALEQSDWLIARHGSEWELVRKGIAGRVEKSAPNEEVLRLGPDAAVLVVSMPAASGQGQEVQCPDRERRDYRKPCSSAFLVCENDPAGFLGALWGGVSGSGMAAARNRYACRADTNAILGAAKAVGMITRIPPVVPKAAPDSKAPAAGAATPLFGGPSP